jgi:uncharacterized protein (DUF1810 family)
MEELSHGLKASHWMWFVFPQIAGLGFSAMAQRFAIGSRAKAVAYLGHDVMGPRLIECTRFVQGQDLVDPEAGEISADDREALRRAVRSLEQPSLAGRLTNLVGKPVELIGAALL